MDACTGAYATVTILRIGNGVYTSWAQNAGYDNPPTVSDICRILKSPWEPLTSTLPDYASGCMVGNFPWLTITGTAIGLHVTIHCGAPGASVWVTGPILHVSEIAHFLRGVEAMNTSLQGEATLPCMEPEFAVTLTAQELGHITMVVAITPDHLSQPHRFTFTIDQSYLPQVIDSCRTLLRQYPVKGQP
jgi:hypothetical protein